LLERDKVNLWRRDEGDKWARIIILWKCPVSSSSTALSHLCYSLRCNFIPLKSRNLNERVVTRPNSDPYLRSCYIYEALRYQTYVLVSVRATRNGQNEVAVKLQSAQLLPTLFSLFFLIARLISFSNHFTQISFQESIKYRFSFYYRKGNILL